MPGASSNPCDDAYRGSQAFSEVEIRNVANYLKSLSTRGQIAGYMDIHAYSQLWMTPWGYTKQPSRDHEELVRKNKRGSVQERLCGRCCGNFKPAGTQ